MQSLNLSGNRLSGDLPIEFGDIAGLESLKVGFQPTCVPLGLQHIAKLNGSPCPAHDANAAADCASDRAALTSGYYAAGTARLGQHQGIATDNNGCVIAIELDQMGLSGPIPRRWSSLSKLERLSLDGNRLIGKIPSELGSLDNLKQLSIRGNRLFGDIPQELGELSLTHLYIAHNLLTGCVPAGLREVENSDLSQSGLPFCE